MMDNEKQIKLKKTEECVDRSRRHVAVAVLGIMLLLVFTMCICLLVGIVHIILPILSTYS